LPKQGDKIRNQQITPECSDQSTVEGTVTFSLKFRSYKSRVFYMLTIY